MATLASRGVVLELCRRCAKVIRHHWEKKWRQGKIQGMDLDSAQEKGKKGIRKEVGGGEGKGKNPRKAS
jgi:hypothetical protein